jgi:predicted acylesterase/phospholipase RssA
VELAIPATESWQGTYTLVAENECGVDEAAVSIVMRRRVALVLAGGGARGAFEVGAVRCLYDVVGLTPDIITGSSVGALNAAKLAEGTGALPELELLWQSLTSNSDFYRPRPWLMTLDPLVENLTRAGGSAIGEWFAGGVGGIVGNVVVSEFIGALAGPPGWLIMIPFFLPGIITTAIDAGNLIWAMDQALKADSLYDLAPTRANVYAAIDPAKVATSGITLRVTVVSLESGQLRYIDGKSRFIDNNAPVSLREAVLASSSIPVVFAPVDLGGEHFVDGGTRENVPIVSAVEAGANYAYVIFPSAPGITGDPSYAGATLGRIGPRALQAALDETQKDDLNPHRGFSIPIKLITSRKTIHDALLVEPGLISINMAYGYMSAYDEVQRNAILSVQQQLRDLSDEITLNRADIWKLEIQAAGERMPDEPARRSLGELYRHSRVPEALEAVRESKRKLRTQVYARIGVAGRQSLPPGNLANWWQAWERHNWNSARTPEPTPWHRFVTPTRTVPAEVPPPP